MPRGGRGTGRGGRGRGRGGSRGRGRGRGHQSTSNNGGSQPTPSPWGIDDLSVAGINNLSQSDDNGPNVQDLFLLVSTTDQHYDAQERDRDGYLATLAVLGENGVEALQGSRIRALASAWARKDHEMVQVFLSQPELFGLVEVLKALTLLDSGRRMREYEKKLHRLEMQGKAKRKTLGPLKSNIDNLNSVKPKHGSVSGAVARHVRRWVRTLPADQLEFYALHLPKEPWRRLADVCHFNPEKDFPNLPWFLRYCYGDAAPDGSMVKSCGHLNAENVNELVKGHDVPYAHLKELNNHLDDVSKARIASYEDKLDTLLWYYEELACEAVDQVIMKRMERGDAVTLPYGKLMERLLTLKIMRENIDKPGSSSNGSGFSTGSTATEESLNKAPFYHLLVPIAEKMLRNISVPLETPVVVIGDASPSMNVAIRTSTIIASLLSAIAHAQLVFFNTYLVKPPFLPESVTQALELAVTVKTDHMTAPAAALKPFYDKKEVVKTFVIVTDECENTSCDGYRFAPLFKKYQEEVYPAKLVFVSFLSSQHSQGSMITALKNLGISALQFKLDSNRPDLSKLDNLLGILSTQDMVSFDEQVSIMKEKVKVQGIQCAFRKTDSDITAVENHDELDNGEYKEDEDTDGIKIDKVKGDENESTQMKNDATKEDQSASVNDIDGALCEKSDAMNENATSDSMNGWVHVKEEDWGTEDF